MERRLGIEDLEERLEERLEELGVRPYREETVEEVKKRYAFVWFFTFLSIIIIEIGAYMMILYLVDAGIFESISFFGIVSAVMGIIISGLTIFDTFWEDRYLIYGIGMCWAAFWIIWSVFVVQPPLSGLLAGMVMVGIGIVMVLVVGVINAIGWVRIERNRAGMFMLIVILCLIFLLIAAHVAISTPVKKFT